MNQSLQASSSFMMKTSLIKSFLEVTFNSVLLLLQQGVPVLDHSLALLAAFTETGLICILLLACC